MNRDALNENLLRRTVIGDLVTRSAERYRDRTCLVSGNERISYRTLNEKSRNAANAFLSMGIKRGDRVAFMTHNCLNYIYCMFGLAKIGAITVPLNFMLRAEEIAYIIEDAEPKVFIVEDSIIETVLGAKEKLKSVEHFCWINFGAKQKPEGWIDVDSFFSGNYPALEPEIIIESDDIVTMIYTTGTEGFPKGVMTTHLNYFMFFINNTDRSMSPDDVFMLDLPLFHGAATVILFSAIYGGGRAFLAYSPNQIQTLEATQQEKITYWGYPPTLFASIPDVPGFEKYDLSSLRKFTSFGAAIPAIIIEKWKVINPKIQWRNTWSQTESTSVGATSRPEEILKKLGTIGLPDAAAEIKVVDDNDQEIRSGQIGELLIRSASVMKGYWKKDEITKKTLANGWLHTGDLGYKDEEGWLYFVDRKKDMIKTGGENVSSQEVEGAVLRHPKVSMAAVIGLPDRYWMEVVAAFVIPKPNMEVTEEEIITFCKKNMAGYKAPKKVFIRSSLPLSANGKILKRELRREMLAKNKE